MFLKIVDNECKKSKIYATDDIYYEFTTTGIQPTRNEKRCHPSKETNALKEVPPFNGEMPPKPSPLKVRKETNVKVNAILPGQLKSLPIFYEETSSATGNTASVTIGDQETDSTGEADISEILGKLSQATDEQFARDILAHADEELPNLSTTSVENEFSTEKATPPPRGKTILTLEQATTPKKDSITKSLEYSYSAVSSLTDDVNLTLADQENRELEEDDNMARCVYCEKFYKEDNSRRLWIGCDGPCASWMHKTCIPKHLRPGHMRKSEKWLCFDCKLDC